MGDSEAVGAGGPPQATYDATTTRPEVLPFVPSGITSLLDVGCADGGFGRLVRERFGRELNLVGIEPMDASRERALGEGYDRILPGYFPGTLADGETFDCITFNDVLEHMVDPWAALRAAHAHLGPGGTVVASLPSVLYLPVLARVVVRRRWDYTDAGTLDRTHLRFFTRATMADMFTDSGYRVRSVDGINNGWYTGRWGRLQRIAPLTGQFQWQQFVVVATPA